MSDTDEFVGMDATDALCTTMYGRRAKPGDYLGGSQAEMLWDAARRIARAKRRFATLLQLSSAVASAPTRRELKSVASTAIRELNNPEHT